MCAWMLNVSAGTLMLLDSSGLLMFKRVQDHWTGGPTACQGNAVYKSTIKWSLYLVHWNESPVASSVQWLDTWRLRLSLSAAKFMRFISLCPAWQKVQNWKRSACTAGLRRQSIMSVQWRYKLDCHSRLSLSLNWTTGLLSVVQCEA